MITAFEGIPFDYNAYIIDSANVAIDMSLASVMSLTLTHIVSGAVIGPITGVAGTSAGYCTFPLSAANLSDTGIYSVEVTYVIGAATETTFGNSIIIREIPKAPTFSVISGESSLVEFLITDSAGNPLDLTAVTLGMYTITNHSTATPIVKAFNAIDLVNGLVSASFTETNPIFGYFTVDTILTSEFKVVPIL